MSCLLPVARPHRAVRRGFTLVELLVSLVVVGVLAATASTFAGHSKQDAIRVSLVSDLRHLGYAQEGYYAAAGTYAMSGQRAEATTAGAVVTRMSLLPMYTPSAGNTIDITNGTGQRFQATARNSALPFTTFCSVHFGVNQTNRVTCFNFE